MNALRQLEKLTSLSVYDTQITNKGIHDLVKLRSLNELNLSDTKHIDDAALAELRSLNQLSVLQLNARKRITDGLLRELSRLESLKELSLRGTEATPTGLGELRNCKTLRVLRLSTTKNIRIPRGADDE